MNNFTITVLSISIALQLTAAAFALRLNRKIHGVGHAWLLIATALMLMATRRVVTFVGFFAPEVEATVKGPVAESIALLIAFLMLAGVLLIPRVFRSLQQAAAALRASEARYRALVDSAEDVIFSLGRDGRYTAINASALRRFGWTEADFVGKSVYDFYPPQEAAFYETQYARVFETGQPARFERHSVNELGDFWFSISLSPIFDATGKVIAISGISHDITERVQAEEALRRRADELNILYDAAIVAATAVHLDEILNRVMHGLQKILKPDAIAILLLEPDSNELVIRASRGFPGGPKLMRRAIGEGIPGWVVETGQPALVADVRDDPRYCACDDDTRSELCVPLRVSERTIGALNIESREVAAFGERDLRLLSILAGHLGMIIENARLYEDVQRYADELERRVQERTAELRKLVNAMAGREIRMAELKDVIRQLRAQLQDAGLTPAADDPLQAGQET